MVWRVIEDFEKKNLYNRKQVRLKESGILKQLCRLFMVTSVTLMFYSGYTEED